MPPMSFGTNWQEKGEIKEEGGHLLLYNKICSSYIFCE